MTVLVWVVGVLLFLSFLAIVFRGAPFVPTRRGDVEAVFSVHSFKAGERFIDLGSGDGRLLMAAAERGIAATGFELNPFLAAYSWLRVRRVHPRPVIRIADFWLTPLPKDTAVVFVFLAGPYMKKLDSKLQSESDRLNKPILLISYGMKVPLRQPEERGGLLIYRYEPADPSGTN
jgi:hypothetical protein